MVEQTSLDALDERPHADAFEGSPRTVRLAIDAGDRIPEHSHPGTDVVLHQLAGELVLELDGENYPLGPGDLLRFSGERAVSPRARTDSRSLLVFAPSED